MNQRCEHEACFADTACALGHHNRSECEHWVQAEPETPKPEAAPDAADIPWNGYALGTRDLAILAGRGQPVVVGLIGAAALAKPRCSLSCTCGFLNTVRFRVGSSLVRGRLVPGSPWFSTVDGPQNHRHRFRRTHQAVDEFQDCSI